MPDCITSPESISFNPFDPQTVKQAHEWGDVLWERYRELSLEIIVTLAEVWAYYGRFKVIDVPAMAEHLGQPEYAVAEALEYLVERGVVAQTPSGGYRMHYSVNEDFHQSFDTIHPGVRLTPSPQPDPDPGQYPVLEQSRSTQLRGFVYLLESGGRYKIGISRDPQKRLAQLRSGQSPFPIVLVHSREGESYIECESLLHKRFAHARVRGEWFELSLEDFKAVIEAMNEWAEGQ